MTLDRRFKTRQSQKRSFPQDFGAFAGFLNDCGGLLQTRRIIVS